jgi:hypothetical protein
LGKGQSRRQKALRLLASVIDASIGDATLQSLPKDMSINGARKRQSGD